MPEFAKARIHVTYAYFIASLGITAALLAAVFQTPALLHILLHNSWKSFACHSLIIYIWIYVVNLTMKIPYTPEDLCYKHITWTTQQALYTILLTQFLLHNAPIMKNCALAMTCHFIGFSATFLGITHSSQDIFIAAQWVLGTGIVLASYLSGLYSFSVYSGLQQLSGFFLYDSRESILRVNSKFFDPLSL
jgi:hypothetical protein